MTRKNPVLRNAISACLAGGLLSGFPAVAQQLEEVIVTATKRVENVQDVPVSIGVVNGEFIAKFDVKDMTEVQNYVPGLTVQSTFGSWAVRVRGMGSGITNLAFDSSVPVYIDGVYCGRGKCLESAFLDVARLEVARGPQGALFGKSTIAGAISVISAQPTDELEGKIKVGAELENGGYSAQGYVSGPLGDSLRGRLAFNYTEQEGFVDNVYVSDDEPEDERWGVRGILAWDISDVTALSLKLETGESDTDGRTNQLVAPGAMSSVSSDPNPEYELDDVRRVSTGVGSEDFYDYEYNLATLTLDTEVAGHTLTGIVGYWDYDNAWRLDVDGGPDFVLNTDLRDNYDQTSAELRILSPTDQTIEYIVGAWYQDSSLETQQYSPFSSLFWQAVGVPPVAWPAHPNGMDRNFERDSEAYSLYGQVTWNVSDRFRAILDLRYTDEEQEGKGWSYPAYFLDGVNPSRAVPGFGPGFNAEYLFDQDRSDDSTDPSLRLQYDINDDMMVYGVWATGSKAGGLKANDGTLGDQLLAACEDPAFCQRYVGQDSVSRQDMIDGLTLEQENGVFDFEDEEAESYELGVKMGLLDGRATLNVALYSMDFDNLQTSSYDGTRFIIQNAASAEVDGVEVEGTWQASDSLRLGAAVAYVDATYDEFMGAQCIVDGSNQPIDPDCVDGEEDLSGERLERTPEWEANISADWNSQLTQGTQLLLNVSMYYSDEYFVRQDFSPNGRQDSFTKWDARIAIASMDDTWEVGVVGRNLSDELTIQHAYEIAGDQFASTSRGRMVTLEASYQF
jgi:iron complex outermembrane receptor protein